MLWISTATIRSFCVIKKYKIFTGCRKASHEQKAKSIGFACWLAMQSTTYFAFRLVDIRTWIVPAIEHQQILFFFDDFDNPLGYVTWANIAPSVEQRLLNDPRFLLHESEWDEGNRTWILDCCFPFGGAAYAVHALKAHLGEQGINKVAWVRRYSDYSVRKVFKHDFGKNKSKGCADRLSSVCPD